MTKASGNTTDVLIVGGGPVGLTLAYELRRHGASCALIDKYSSLLVADPPSGREGRAAKRGPSPVRRGIP